MISYRDLLSTGRRGLLVSALAFCFAGCDFDRHESGLENPSSPEVAASTSPPGGSTDARGSTVEPVEPLIPADDTSESSRGSEDLVNDALTTADDIAAQKERLEAERVEQERRQRELEAREAAIAEREQRLALERQERERREQAEAAAAERRNEERQRQAMQARQQAQAAELARAEQEPQQPQPDAEGPTTERAVIVAEDAVPLDEPWSGDEDWRAGNRTADATSSSGADSDSMATAGEPPTAPAIDAYATAQRLRPGTRFEVEIEQTISSATAQVGDVIATRLAEDIVDARGNLLVRAGTELRGEVTEVKALRRVGGRATLGVVIDRIVLPSGDEIEIRASLREFGRNKKGDKFRIAGAAVAGAILGGIFGDAEGAVAGAAAGAAAGTAAVARVKGEDVVLEEGTVLELELEGIVTVHEEIGDVVRR